MESFPMKTDLIQIKGKAKNGKVKVVKYDRSFLSRVIQNEKSKRFYDEIKNYCMSFERVKGRSAWSAESFAVGNETIVKLIWVGGALCACVALSPDAYSQKDYPHADYSSKREFASTPMMLPIRTVQEAKIAKRMIAEAFTNRCVYTVEFPARTDYVEALPMQKDETLLKKKLIKKSESEMSEADAKKAVATALKAEAEEEKELEEIGGVKKKRAPKKAKNENAEDAAITEEVAPAPVEETRVVKAETADIFEQNEDKQEDADAEDDVIDTVFELASDGLVIEVKYDRSFVSRIIQNQKAKEYYSDLKNFALSFGVKPRLSWKAESFYLGRKTYFLLKVRGKTLCLYLAADPAKYEERIYHHKDVSAKKTYEKTPMMVRVKSDLGLKKAKVLLLEIFAEAALAQKETGTVDYAAQYPYESTETLIEKKLIKRFERKLDEEESALVIERGLTESEPEDVTFELAEEDAPEEVDFDLSEETDDVEDVDFELAEEGADPQTGLDSDDEEDVSFELVQEITDERGGMESYGKEGEDGKFVTLKKYVRGFLAKMRQGDQDRKDYYAEIKAKMLSYKGVKLSESFSGDSYKKGARALLKTRIRGKTLCLFFALNTDNYKQTVFRQQYKGDTKAYAATPMMVRVKSEQGLKRAMRLIDDLERNYLLQAGDAPDLLAVRGEFLFEETPVLVEKGLIKTRLVTVTEYEAEQLLKKKSK